MPSLSIVRTAAAVAARFCHSAGRALPARRVVALAALAGSGAWMPAAAEVTMMFDASYERTSWLGGTLQKGQIDGTWAAAPNHQASVGVLQGSTFARLDGAHLGFTPITRGLGAFCHLCLDLSPPGTAIATAYVDARQGVFRGTSHVRSDLKDNGPAEPPSPEAGRVQAQWGTVDQLNVRGGALMLSLDIDAEWAAFLDPTLGTDSRSMLAATVVLERLTCTRSACVSAGEVGRLSFVGHEGNYESTDPWQASFQWNDESVTLGDHVHDGRELRLGGLPRGTYRLTTTFSMDLRAWGGAGADLWFGHTGYVGVTGDYESASGYAYLGRAAQSNDVPLPPTLPLLMAGLAALRPWRRNARRQPGTLDGGVAAVRCPPR